MKKNILVSVGLVAVALGITLVVWLWLQGVYKSTEKIPTSPTEVMEAIMKTNDTAVDKTTTQPKTDTTDNVAKDTTSEAETFTPTPLSDFSLTPEQKAAAEAAGIDVDSVMITVDMIECARTKISPQRVEEILGGNSPTFMETLSLVGCVKQ
jgi:cytoskeletal protein RodZ